jgi:hypothetical protein
VRKSRTPLIAALAIGLLAGASVGVTAQEEYAEPDEFTGKWSFGSQLIPDADIGQEDLNGAIRITGGAWRYIATGVTDPRFDGEVTVFSNWDDIETATGEATIRKTAWLVENKDGSWQSDVLSNYHFPDRSAQIRTFTFVGEGAYDGLTAIVELDQEDGLHGIITDRDLPPDPEPRSIE